MKPVGNIPIQQVVQINSESITYRQGDIIRAKIESINNNELLIKLFNGQTLLARVEGQRVFETGSWVFFEILEWTQQLIKLKPLDKTLFTPASLVDQYMEMLGLMKTPENEGLLYYMLIQAVPLNKENVLFFMNKRFQLSTRVRLLMQTAAEAGMTDHLRALDNTLLRLDFLAGFLKSMPSKLEKIHHEIVNLCEKLVEKDSKEKTRTLIRDIFTGILFQMNGDIPFQMVQLPIKLDEQLVDSEIWLDKESDTIYIEIKLPRLGITGCLLKGWKSKADLSLYCQPAYQPIIEREKERLRSALIATGIKVAKVEVYNILVEHGLRRFLKGHWNEREIIDLKV